MAITNANLARRRINVAKDALKYLEKGKVVPTTGQYLNRIVLTKPLPNLTDDIRGSRDANIKTEVFNKLKSCEVCALGGLFVAYVSKFNQFVARVHNKQTYLGYPDNSVGIADLNQERIVAYSPLAELFGTKQLLTIEAFFEGRFVNTGSPEFDVDELFTDDERDDLHTMIVRFHDHVTEIDYESSVHDDEVTRFTLIMQNIIDNGGTFTPSKLPGVMSDDNQAKP